MRYRPTTFTKGDICFDQRICGENVLKLQFFPRLGLLFIRASNLFLANLHSKFECQPITKNVFPVKLNNFYIGRI
jgi:hypothetical protein